MPTVYLVNPANRPKRTARRTKNRRRKNPALLISAMNGGKKMAKARSRRRPAARKNRSRRRNPQVKVITRYRNGAGHGRRVRHSRRRNPHRGRRRNPLSLSLAGYGVKDLLIGASGAVGGAIAVPALTSKVLGTSNRGAIGYGANALVAFGLGYTAYKFVPNKAFGIGVAFGGVGSIVRRFWDEYVSGLVPVAMMAVTGGEHDGKQLGDVSFGGPGAYMLQGYYHTAGGPQLSIGDRYGEETPMLPAASPIARHMADCC